MVRRITTIIGNKQKHRLTKMKNINVIMVVFLQRYWFLDRIGRFGIGSGHEYASVDEMIDAVDSEFLAQVLKRFASAPEVGG